MHVTHEGMESYAMSWPKSNAVKLFSLILVHGRVIIPRSLQIAMVFCCVCMYEPSNRLLVVWVDV